MIHTTEQDRAAFEAWMSRQQHWRNQQIPHEWLFVRNERGEYARYEIALAYDAWQATRQPKEAMAPQSYVLEDDGGMSFLDGQESRFSIYRQDGTHLAWVSGDTRDDGAAVARELMDALNASQAVQHIGDCEDKSCKGCMPAMPPVTPQEFSRDIEAITQPAPQLTVWMDLNTLHAMHAAPPSEKTRWPVYRLSDFADKTNYVALTASPSNSAEFDRVKTIAEALPGAMPNARACWCAACDVAANGRGLMRTRMSVCPDCGDKRCARAERHDNLCNAPYKQST